jgi:hypothetical protein
LALVKQHLRYNKLECLRHKKIQFSKIVANDGSIP